MYNFDSDNKHSVFMDYESNSKHKINLVMSFQLKNSIAFQNDQYWKTTFAHNSSLTQH